jgi:hypothetical protein
MTTVSRAIAWLRALAILAIATSVNMPAARAESAGSQDQGKLSPAQIEQLVAPIALYPDALMSQVLMASTYPLEVVEAARWSRDNAGITGQALEDAMQNQSWDPSVKALTAVPQTLQMMNDKLDWTQQLGDVFLAQQQDVLDAAQRLRARADAAGNLKTTPQQKVAKVAAPPAAGSTAPPTTVYTIEPATPDEYYVPIYDPGVVYGAWPYPDYAPFYWYPPGYVASGALGFATGVAVGWAIWGRVDWWQHRVNINVNRFNRFNHTNITRNAWVHDPAHRGNVPYRDRNVANRFGDQGKNAARESYREKADAGRRELGKEGGGRQLDAKGKGAAKSNVAARSKEGAGTKHAATTRKAAGTREAGRQRTASHHPAARRDVGTHARAQAVHAGGGGGRGGRRR